jgi:sulfite reductase alpha subunit-like flavoprotein
MKLFWNFLLQKKLKEDYLENLKFALFGLGDSSYPLFSFVGKKLFRRLTNLGAKPLFERKDGDDQSQYGYEDELQEFLSLLWKHALNEFPLNEKETVEPDEVLEESTYMVELESEKMQDEDKMVENKEEEKGKLRIIENKRVTKENHFQDVRRMKFEVLDQQLSSYEPGDTLGIKPKNSKENIESLLKRLKWNGKDRIKVTNRGSKKKESKSLETKEILFESISLYELFELFLDILFVPRRRCFEILRHFSTNEKEKERLDYFSSNESIVR